MIKFLSVSILFLIIGLTANSADKKVNIVCSGNSPVLKYGSKRLNRHLTNANYSVTQNSKNENDFEIRVLLPGEDLKPEFQKLMEVNRFGIEPDGYKLIKGEKSIHIIGQNDKGCLYGIMDVLEQLGTSCNFSNLEERQVNPALSFRAIKFNLPWSPYRPGPATALHVETCRDLKFWEAFLDRMVKNRFNALTLWNTHPFPYMIRAKNFPKATPFSADELEDWKSFWKSLFQMAKVRGIETYLVNWNIVVSPEFAENYGAEIHDDRSELVKKYTRESVTQVINEYPNLTGLGVTLADWMGNWGENKMTPKEREDWIDETFVDGMKQADRKIKFIHRAVLAGDPKEMQRVIDHANLPEKTIVEVKFNWSHGHSTPDLAITHANDEGSIMSDLWEPKPENYFIAWTIRNEDFFVLRWGEPDFIRKHIAANNHDYVDGYFVGSEGYIPAQDYSQIPGPEKTWDYAFQKQWMFYHLWGRLLYNPEVSDKTLAREIQNRYENLNPESLLKAYSLASRVPLEIASFYKGTWDFTLYSEGFLAPWPNGFDDGKSPFISIEELIKHETLAPNYLSISDYCKLKNEGKTIDENLTTPPELARKVNENCTEALATIEKLRLPGNSPTLDSELDDLATWCQLGFYFADKLMAGVALEQFNLTGNQQKKDQAIEFAENGLAHWKNVVALTADRYKPMPYVSFGHHEPRWPEFTAFHWSKFLDDVKADIEYIKNQNKKQ